MSDQSFDIAPLFDGSKNDTAVQILRDLFGSIVDKVSGTTSGYDGSSIITTVLTVFNLFILFCGVCVFTYSSYSTMLDTSRDGEIGGRNSDPQKTALRMLMAAAGLVPVSGGLSLVQVLFLFLIVKSSAVAGYANGKVATYLVEQSSSYVAQDILSTHWQVGQKIAHTMDAMVKGHLCALYANRISGDLQTGSGALTASTVNRDTGFFDSNTNVLDRKVVEWGFTAGTQYKKMTDMCGRVQIYTSAPSLSTLSGGITDAGSIDQKMGSLGASQVLAGANAALSIMDSAASGISQKIYDNNLDTDGIKATILQTISSATTAYYKKATISDSSANNLSKSVITSIQDDGWIWAALWQRVMTKYAVTMNGYKDTAEFVVDDDVNPKAAGSLRARFFGWAGLGSPEERAIFADVDRSFDYLKTFEATYQNAASPIRTTNGTSFERMSAADQQAQWVAPIQWLYNEVLSNTQPAVGNGWHDPLLAVQAVGDQYMIVGAEVAAGGASLGVIGATAGGAVGGPMTAAAGYQMGSMVGGFLVPVGKFLMGAGMLMAGVLPLMPVVFYFSGGLAWIVMVIESVVAASVWCLLGLLPSRQDSIIGENKQGLMLLISVLFRPILMVFGLMASYVFMYEGLNLLNRMWSTILSTVIGGTMSEILIGVAALGMYVLLVGSIVMTACGLITGIGDAVMQWIGAGVSQLGKVGVADKIGSTLDPTSNIASSGHAMPGQAMQGWTRAAGADLGRAEQSSLSPARFGRARGAAVGARIRKLLK